MQMDPAGFQVRTIGPFLKDIIFIKDGWDWSVPGYDTGSNPRSVPSPVLPVGSGPLGKCSVQTSEDKAIALPSAGTTTSTLCAMASTPTSKLWQGAVSPHPIASPLVTSAFGTEAFPLPPSSPCQKFGPGFWSSIPGSPASRPGAFTFSEDGGEVQVRQGSNLQSGCGGQIHRLSTHSKEADRMSTCSSASEQSIQSTQSNGVRQPGADPTNMEVGDLSCAAVWILQCY